MKLLSLKTPILKMHPHPQPVMTPGPEAGALGFVVTTLLPVWLFGLVTGLMFPRQAVLSDVRAWLCSAAASAVSLGARSTLLSQAMMFINGALFVQSLWFRFTEPGTFTALVARVAGALGLALPANAPSKGEAAARDVPDAGEEVSTWYISRKDLDFFVERTSGRGDVAAGPWETIVEKDIPGVVKYHSQRRTCKDIRKTEYLSTSITTDTTPHEVRCHWCTYVSDAQSNVRLWHKRLSSCLVSARACRPDTFS